LRAILLGVLAAFFFSVTFILNRAMSLTGGSWIWSASLRYFFMIPFLLIIVMNRNGLTPLFLEMKRHLGRWLVWSTVGFGLFYAPLCFASDYGPGWLVAGTWQFTIIAGSLLMPFFYESIQTKDGLIKIRRKIPVKGLMLSLIILLGIVLMQIQEANHLSIKILSLSIGPVIIASFAYPLGNRKMMECCGGRLDTYQRVLGMTIASLPFWICMSVIGIFTVGLPIIGQTAQSLIVAISSGVIATVLFFRATDMVKDNAQNLASVEATQSLEVLFTVIGELIILGIPLPAIWSWLGMALVIFGMILHSYFSHRLTNTRHALPN
jgi:drug/metabolite transporter (DMT)-like permease